ncbi:hypothetical protein [Spirillospora sp. NPDC048819]|uniref:hypothetical protein n=1 Tax=Spirillospora sp. NPDC048819 TaxID=3155268 RepID=UPI00340B3013
MAANERSLAHGSRPQGGGAAWRLLAGSIAFLVFYLSVSFVTPSLASDALPLPNDPAAETRAWYAGNAAAAVATGVCQLLSVAFLALFVQGLVRAAAGPERERIAGRARAWGYGAVALMAASSVLSWTLAAVASSASVDTVSVLRTANFIAGGTAHVVALGVFVLLASRMPGFGKGVRGFAWVVAVPAVASLISIVVFEGAALILLGRLLGMIWTISAAVSVTRGLSRGTWPAARGPRTMTVLSPQGES